MAGRGTARRGRARPGLARHGKARQGRHSMTNHMFRVGTVWGTHEIIEHVHGEFRNRSGRMVYKVRVRCVVCKQEKETFTYALGKLRETQSKYCNKCPADWRRANRKPPGRKNTLGYEYKLDVPDEIAKLAFGRRK